MELTIDSARALRDGGIDALAALDAALADTLALLPEAQHAEVKRAIGKAMGAVIEETISRAVSAFPQLSPQQAGWSSIAKAKLMKRAEAAVIWEPV
ncbi:hypothetical protein [Pseudomonas sp. TE3610]